MRLGGFAAAVAALAAAACASQTPAHAPFAYLPVQLDVKTIFANEQAAAVAEPFIGLRTIAGIEKGLFPITASGVSTAPVQQAAATFLKTLSPDQLLRTQFGVGDPEWRRWYNVDNGIYLRQGVPLREMTQQQRDAAFALMRATLSARGFALTEAIRKTDQTLRELAEGDPELNGNAAFWLDEDLYYFTVMGAPSDKEPWGWQLDGHHLVINCFILGDQMVMTPTFFGAEPAVARSGKYAGNAVLQEEQDQGLALMRSLDGVQGRFATLDGRRKTTDMLKAGADQDNLMLDYEGVPVETFTQAQKDQLLALIERFVGTMEDGHAKIRMDEVAAHLDHTWFAWVGEVSDTAVFYYRIHSPVILIEFDHQLPVGSQGINPPGQVTRDHIHTIIRTPNGNDYGKDLLAQHLATHRH